MLGTLTGVFAGVAIGMLCAPASGAKRDKRSPDGAGQLRRKFNQLIGASADELDELKDVFSSEISGLKDDVRERVLQLIKATKASGNNIRRTSYAVTYAVNRKAIGYRL